MVDVGAAPIDRYVVLEHLSEGGMGAIYVGKKLGAGGFEMQVVLKQLLPEFTQQEEFIDLFLREAKLSATLDHANIVHTIDLVTAGNEYFIVMEYLAGGDLRTLLKKAKRRGQRFSPAAAIHICREVLSALAYAHVKRDLEGKPLKLIHRDVSPSNILVSYGGEVKLTDFGIAKAATHNSLFYKVKGKIGYMSPEQAKSEPLDHRSDLYSLAVCLYEVITAERLFVHAGLTTSAEEIYSQPVPQVSRKVPGLTPDFDAVMNKALAISPTDRYQTAGEFQEALTRCAHRNGLLISAPEVARELLELCGPPEQWRGEDDDEDFGFAGKRAGTEVYDGGDDDDDDAAAPSIHGIAQPPRSSSPKLPAARNSSAKIPRAEPKLQGVVELTSIINMIDLENQHREAVAAGLVSESGRLIPPLMDEGTGAQTSPVAANGPRGVGSLGGAGGAYLTGPLNGPPGPATLLGTPGAFPGMPASRGSMPAMSQPGPTTHRGVPTTATPVDPRDLLPTLPRRVPAVPGQPPEPVRARAPVPAQVPQFHAGHRASPAKKKSVFSPWIVILVLLIAGAAAAVVVAMSGPDVENVKHSK